MTKLIDEEIKPKISIVIPTKNRANKIKLLLRELLKQSIIPNEIIVVDDSNNFETRYVIESLRHAFSKRNIKLFYTRDSNSAARARLIGGLMAQGDVIIYVDDDLYLQYYTLERLLTILIKTKAIATWGRINFPDTKFTKRGNLFLLLSKLFGIIIFGCPTIGGGLFAVRKEALKNVRFDWNLPGFSLFEDQDFSCGLIRYYGYKNVVYLDKPVLAVNRGILIKNLNFFLHVFGNSFYLCYKWRGIYGLITFTFFSPFLCSFYIITKGGVRGILSVKVLKILKCYLYIFKNLRSVISGDLKRLYALYKNKKV